MATNIFSRFVSFPIRYGDTRPPTPPAKTIKDIVKFVLRGCFRLL